MNRDVAGGLGGEEHTVSRWRARFVRDRLEGLADEPCPGGPRKIADAQVDEVVVKTPETTPRDATTADEILERLAGYLKTVPNSGHRPCSWLQGCGLARLPARGAVFRRPRPPVRSASLPRHDSIRAMPAAPSLVGDARLLAAALPMSVVGVGRYVAGSVSRSLWYHLQMVQYVERPCRWQI
ncbi:helix-turn-helix domain-containing protein [Streptomyces halobius]|nr:helix-turn-helix domain-containing protein [Streptomyces halobius]